MTHPSSIPVTPAQLALNLAGRNTAEAIRLLTPLALNNNIEAMLLLGQLYLDGGNIPAQPEQAFVLFQSASQLGSAMGFNMLGRCHEHGWGVAVNAEQAARCFQEASKQGLDWGHYNLANLYATGRGLEQNQERAFALYWQAAQQGHAKSMNLVGRYYQEGITVNADNHIAEQWYLRSANAGDFRGQISLAGALVEKGDITSAVEWLKQALQTANTAALSKLYPSLLKMSQPELREIGETIQQKLEKAR